MDSEADGPQEVVSKSLEDTMAEVFAEVPIRERDVVNFLKRDAAKVIPSSLPEAQRQEAWRQILSWNISAHIARGDTTVVAALLEQDPSRPLLEKALLLADTYKNRAENEQAGERPNKQDIITELRNAENQLREVAQAVKK